MARARGMPGDWYEDEWHEEDFHRSGVVPSFSHVRAPPSRRSGDLLVPDAGFGSSLRRSRSTGHAPAPNVYVYTSTSTTQKNESRSPSPSRTSRGRRDHRNDDIVDKLSDIDRDIRRLSRSRGPEFRVPESYHVPDYRAPSPAPYRDTSTQLELARERQERLHAEEREREDRIRAEERERVERLRAEERLADRLRDFDRSRDTDKMRDMELLKVAETRIQRFEDERYKEIDARERHERDEELYKKKLELSRLRDRIQREENEARLESRDKEWKSKLELERLKEDQKRRDAEIKRAEEKNRVLAEKEREEREAKAERNRIKLEIERKEREDEEERRRIKLELEHKEKEEEDERKAIVDRYNAQQLKKKKEADEAAAKAVAEWKQKEADKKREEEELKEKFRREEEMRKRKEKEEEERWKAKLSAKELEEREKEKKRKKDIEDEVHKKLSVFGLQENQIDVVMHPKKAHNLPQGATPHNPLIQPTPPPPRPALGWQQETPTYIKVHRDHVDIETLRYYGLPWEYDTVDSNYIIILQEIDSHETELLFEHTRKLRRGGAQLLIEDRGRHGGRSEYAFVRRRKPSASPARRKRSPTRSNVSFRLF